MIRIENIVKTYKEGAVCVEAIKNISFDVEAGEFLSIMGTSGSGKTSLLNIIAGLDIPDSGKIYIDNQDITKLDLDERTIYRRENIGMVFQFFNLVSVLTVQENIAFTTQMAGRSIDEKRMDHILDLLNLSDRKDFFPDQLSGGQQQRVAIGRAVFSNPKVILADEPTGNLDSKNSREIMEMLRTLNKEFGKTIIMVTHDEAIAGLTDRILLLEDGIISHDNRN